ncbi:Sperm mitochondrial-associated cysteine-rich protein [Plecturocebus cupreus]
MELGLNPLPPSLQKMCDQPKHSQCCPPKGNQCCPPTTNQCCQPKGNQCCPPKHTPCCQPKPPCCIQAKCCGLETTPESSPVNKEPEPNSPQTQDKGSQTQQQPHSPQYESRLRK